MSRAVLAIVLVALAATTLVGAAHVAGLDRPPLNDGASDRAVAGPIETGVDEDELIYVGHCRCGDDPGDGCPEPLAANLAPTKNGYTKADIKTPHLVLTKAMKVEGVENIWKEGTTQVVENFSTVQHLIDRVNTRYGTNKNQKINLVLEGHGSIAGGNFSFVTGGEHFFSNAGSGATRLNQFMQGVNGKIKTLTFVSCYTGRGETGQTFLDKVREGTRATEVQGFEGLVSTWWATHPTTGAKVPHHTQGIYTRGKSRNSKAAALNCPEDANFDGMVDVLDLLTLLDHWGECDDPADCPLDFNGDGLVDVLDLLILLDAWGPCPDPTGACCVNGTCAIATPDECAAGGGEYVGDQTECDECFEPSASCAGECDSMAEAGCFCDEHCPTFGDCCDDVCDACEDLAFCAKPSGACCAGAKCLDGVPADACAALPGGVFMGHGVKCAENTCFGACCIDGDCIGDAPAAECISNGGTFMGGGSSCADIKDCP